MTGLPTSTRDALTTCTEVNNTAARDLQNEADCSLKIITCGQGIETMLIHCGGISAIKSITSGGCISLAFRISLSEAARPLGATERRL